ncbi:transcription elongation factor GreA [Lactobacillus delbrueckii subsp. lactis]|jgi:transcription elongation factor GreA|uniref:Transcription elongation factor GreA n=2 Tax=Lactobacillus delbrueckii TaxID=1584 RepID=A0A061CDU2_LACDL|nr:transcription elongation factor GreA [Lactobacillus delbrueckii]APG69026.1 transcription elongation factor GreA [Lactobacillus delbrueckii subsp. lactis]ASW12323.1 transcription elongation factor GreA [Lactobacillus delbrueckii subsp. lactis DSM 20072]ASW64162.1 transcription elongation factor GreA [Lactobacillus delbrueckii subsp. lactis]AZA15795.1 MAG: transcription elongation factor GreA [Lactobacillus delbrueckii subsp. lactis]AZA25634.1 MAG: transcription elongation factor GreA [Lactob
MPEKIYEMTAEGKKQLEEELQNLKFVKRPQIVERLKIARSYGDLSENSEYDAAKDEQMRLEERIDAVSEQLKYAVIVDTDAVDPDEVSIGKTVTVTEVGEDEPETYEIVGSSQSDPFHGKVSNESPIGKALLGHKKGETVKINVDSANVSYDVVINDVKTTD